MVHINSNDVRFKIAGNRSKSNLSAKKKQRQLLSQRNSETIIHKEKITRSQAQKKYFSSVKGKLSLALAQKNYFSTEKGRNAKSFSQQSYVNTEKGKKAKSFSQQTYVNTEKGKNAK